MQSLRKWPVLAVVLALAAGPARAVAQVVADAGDDVHGVSCAGRDGTRVTLDGSGSVPAEVSYLWSAPGVRFNDPASPTPTGLFPLGVTTVELTVSVEGGTSDTDEVDVEVVDRTPPTIAARASPDELWPPDHKLRDVHVFIRTADDCSGNVRVVLTSVTSSEPENGRGDGNTSGDIQGADLGTDDRDLQLRAERQGGGEGRVYTLAYRATDAAGNHADALARVRVPHDQGRTGDHQHQDGPPHWPFPRPEICPLPTAAVEIWAEVLPDPTEFETERACRAACQGWSTGCSQIASGALGCARSERMGAYFFKLMRCLGISDAERRQECMLQARDALTELRGVSAELEAARALCAENSTECRTACGGAF